jgi:hypothetical protein
MSNVQRLDYHPSSFFGFAFAVLFLAGAAAGVLEADFVVVAPEPFN